MKKETQITTLLNPYSIRLEKDPFMRVEGNPIHVNGDFRIYKHCAEWYIHTFKNIVIAERTKANKEVLTNVMGTTKPTGEVSVFHDFERPRATMLQGIKEAKKRNFKII